MLYKDWEPIYHEILKDFSFSKEQDIKAAHLLDSLLSHHPGLVPLSDLFILFKQKPVIIIGAGSQVEYLIEKHQEKINSRLVITADGATSAALQHDIIPDVIVTDLDGNIPDQLMANAQGSILVVHAHGDNIKVIRSTIPQVPKKILGTIQTNPKGLFNVVNMGGFTDGDRAVYLADHLLAHPLYLLGFDFHGPIGSFSQIEKKDCEMKHKKLVWAEKLITRLHSNGHIQFLD